MATDWAQIKGHPDALEMAVMVLLRSTPDKAVVASRLRGAVGTYDTVNPDGAERFNAVLETYARLAEGQRAVDGR